MKKQKMYRTALAVTGLGSVALALILAFSPLGNGAGIDCKDHAGFMHGRASQEEMYLEKGNHGKGGAFFILAAGAVILLVYYRGRKSAGTNNGMNTETEPVLELAALYAQGTITRDEFLRRKSILEEDEK